VILDLSRDGRGLQSEEAMNRLLFFVDEISTWVGKTFAWCIVILTAAMTYEVVARYLFRAPTEWAFDASYMLYGALFMIAGASNGGLKRPPKRPTKPRPPAIPSEATKAM
jgi:hypothetical protein